jgi:hypothetical protein
MFSFLKPQQPVYIDSVFTCGDGKGLGNMRCGVMALIY